MIVHHHVRWHVCQCATHFWKRFHESCHVNYFIADSVFNISKPFFILITIIIAKLFFRKSISTENIGVGFSNICRIPDQVNEIGICIYTWPIHKFIYHLIQLCTHFRIACVLYLFYFSEKLFVPRTNIPVTQISGAIFFESE